jgi:ABC-2 type transport system permease protein
MRSLAACKALTVALASATVTRARLAGLVGLGLLAVVVGLAIGLAGPPSPTVAGADLVNLYGLGILAPVVTLVIASAVLGDTIEDNTLVYLWLRPIPRMTIAGSAGLASFAIAAPVVVAPLVVAAALTGGSGALLVGTALGAALAVLGYTGAFVLLGLLTKRSLLWGVMYILIWEGFIARAGTSSSQFSVQYYARSVLAEVADVSLRLGDASMGAALTFPIVVTALALGIATVRLRHINVA